MERESTLDLESEGENDSDGYFLEPSFCATSIEDRIAEANRQLFDENVSQEECAEDDRPRKVQFCEDLVDFAPDTPETLTFFSDADSQNEEETEPTPEEDTPEPETPETVPEPAELSPDEETAEDQSNTKLLLVLLPREQSSSCESIMGEEQEENEEKIVEEKPEPAKVRPKSAHKGTKHKRGSEKIQCKLVTICPELTSSLESETKAWHEGKRQRGKPRTVCSQKASQLLEAEQVLKQQSSGVENSFPVMRPKTAPSKRACCVVRSDLPHYNGFRSEYGLSAQQLEERKLKNAEIRHQRKQQILSKQENEHQKRIDNEEKFTNWLEEKISKPKTTNSRKIDTLVRSDVYIQKNAVYASKCGVPYAVNYTNHKITEIRKKTINLGKLFETISPHAQKTYQIYVGNKND